MTDQKTPDKKTPAQLHHAELRKQQKNNRLQQALRNNLHRRKQQQQGRSSIITHTEPEKQD